MPKVGGVNILVGRLPNGGDARNAAKTIRERAAAEVRWYRRAAEEAELRGDGPVAAHCRRKRKWWENRMPEVGAIGTDDPEEGVPEGPESVEAGF